MDDLIYIANISSTHHLLGAVKVNTSFNNLEDLINQKIMLKKENDIKILTLVNIKELNDKKKIFKFLEITNLEMAKQIKGYSVYARKDQLKNYEEEISVISYNVFDQKNAKIGQVIDILETAAHDILVIEGEKEILIPFIDVFVKEIDDDNKKIFVETIDGM